MQKSHDPIAQESGNRPCGRPSGRLAPAVAALCLILAIVPAPLFGQTSVHTLAGDNAAFAVDLYRQVCAGEGNLFLSPYSVSSALAMTLAGAGGETARQMNAALRFSLGPDALHPAFAEMAERVGRIQSAGDVTLRAANALWPQDRHPFREAFLSLVRAHYGAAVRPQNYIQDAEGARQRINADVAEHTERKITDLIPAGILNDMTRLVLTNAIYFKGNWASPFRPEHTKDAPFFLQADQGVPVPMMQQKDRFGYAETPKCQILEIPYAGDAVSMLVLLPRAVDGLSRLESDLTRDNLSAWRQSLNRREVRLLLPRFKMTARFRLDAALKALGMTDAFDEARADFSGMDGGAGRLFIGAVLHKAYVDVNGQGTEAAAATGVVVGLTAMAEPPPEFRADHPFVFMILERETGTILFLGRVTDPRAE